MKFAVPLNDSVELILQNLFDLMFIYFLKGSLYHSYMAGMRGKSWPSLLPQLKLGTSMESLLPSVAGLEFLPASCSAPEKVPCEQQRCTHSPEPVLILRGCLCPQPAGTPHSPICPILRQKGGES